MSKSKLTCGKEVEPVLKVIVIIDLVISVLWGLDYLLVGIMIVSIPESKEMKHFLTFAGYDLENEDDNTYDEVKFYGWTLIVASLLGVLLGVYLFWTMSTGMKKKNYIKCRRWFIICVILVIISVMTGIHSAFFAKTTAHPRAHIISCFQQLLFSAYDLYGLLVASVYLKDLKRGVEYFQDNEPDDCEIFNKL